MQTINKHSVLKAVRTKGLWMGYIAPSKVVEYHVNDGWHLGHLVTISQGRDNQYYVVSWHNEYNELESWINNFSYYNCNSAIGQRIRFWEVS